MHRIMHPNGDGVSIIIPAEKSGLPIEQIARKDVPAGVPYRIVATADIPTDRSQRDLWAADFSAPDGHGIGADAWFAEQEASKLLSDGTHLAAVGELTFTEGDETWARSAWKEASE